MFLPRLSRLLWISLLTLGLGSGCGQRLLDEDGGTDDEDAGLDAGVDGGSGDAGTRPDGGQDAGSDAGSGPITDGGQDAGQVGEGGPVETVITAGPSGTVRSNSATFEFGANVPGSTFQCSLDLEPDGPCSSPVVYDALSDAEHTFQVFAQGPDGGVDATPASRTWTVDSTLPPEVTIRVMAANTTNGPAQKYDAAGTRIFQGLKPDVVLIQEFTLDSTLGPIDAWVDSTFGTEFDWKREPIESGENIPNGVISRWPIVSSGQWIQPTTPGAGETRDFFWAQIDIPGSIDLWVVSLHLATTDGDRPNEASVLLGYLQEFIPEEAYLVLGGDLNTDSRTETAINTLSAVVDTAGPFPVDQAGNSGTNNPNGVRGYAPYDWVLAESQLRAFETPVVIGANSFPNGLVFDCRAYSPLTDVAPVQSTDCNNLQHMAVIRDFLLPQ